MTLGHHTKKEAEHYKKAKTEARVNENYGLSHPHCPCKIVGFESDQSSASTSSSVSSGSDRSGGSRHSNCSQQHCRESRGHKKIKLPVFKDEDTKDGITY